MQDNSVLPRLDQMLSYLKSNGWKKQTAGNCCKVAIYSNGQDVSLTLPISDKFIDYQFKMRTALEALSAAEGVPQSALLDAILEHKQP